jgi:hypothetical protein
MYDCCTTTAQQNVAQCCTHCPHLTIAEELSNGLCQRWLLSHHKHADWHVGQSPYAAACAEFKQAAAAAAAAATTLQAKKALQITPHSGISTVST